MTLRGLTLYGMVLTAFMDRDPDAAGLDIAPMLLSVSPTLAEATRLGAELEGTREGQAVEELIEAVLEAASIGYAMLRVISECFDQPPESICQTMLAGMQAEYEA